MKSFIVCLFLSFYCCFLSQVYSQGTNSRENIQNNAFQVLVLKCNVCHATKKRQDIFTLENMDSLSESIHKQVFIKKKMPKGKKIKLTYEELKALREWLDLTAN